MSSQNKFFLSIIRKRNSPTCHFRGNVKESHWLNQFYRSTNISVCLLHVNLKSHTTNCYKFIISSQFTKYLYIQFTILAQNLFPRNKIKLGSILIVSGAKDSRKRRIKKQPLILRVIRCDCDKFFSNSMWRLMCWDGYTVRCNWKMHEVKICQQRLQYVSCKLRPTSFR